MTREELYNLIWSEPAKTIAPRFGFSDVALPKLCQKHEIPQPPRGYWAKLAAGKKVAKFPLPPRGLGIPEFIDATRDYRWGYFGTPPGLIDMDLGPRPTFGESIEDMTTRVRKEVGKVAIPRDFSRAHHAVQTLLAADEQRRAVYLSKSYRSSWDAPFYDSAFEKRRLRLINALLLALAKLGCRPSMSRRKDPDGFEYRVGLQTLGITVDEPGYSRTGWRTDKDMAKPATTTMKVSIGLRSDVIQTEWQDKGDDRVEDHIADVVVMAMVAGELKYRGMETGQYDWLVERKAQLIEEARRAQEEQERKERERLEAERKARIDGLLGDAARHRQANDIRDYVAAVRAAKVRATPEQVERWAGWALAQADDLDPLLHFRVDGEPS